MELDVTDRRLLRALQRDARQTHEQLGRAVHLSASSVRRRLTALRAAGVIRAEVALLGDQAFGKSITVIALVAFERESTRTYRDFRRRMLADAAVLQCHSISGEYDFVLTVAARDPAHYESWSQRVLLGDGNIARYDSFVVWSTVKNDPQPQVSLEARP